MVSQQELERGMHTTMVGQGKGMGGTRAVTLGGRACREQVRRAAAWQPWLEKRKSAGSIYSLGDCWCGSAPLGGRGGQAGRKSAQHSHQGSRHALRLVRWSRQRRRTQGRHGKRRSGWGAQSQGRPVRQRRLQALQQQRRGIAGLSAKKLLHNCGCIQLRLRLRLQQLQGRRRCGWRVCSRGCKKRRVPCRQRRCLLQGRQRGRRQGERQLSAGSALPLCSALAAANGHQCFRQPVCGVAGRVAARAAAGRRDSGPAAMQQRCRAKDAKQKGDATHSASSASSIDAGGRFRPC